VSSSYKRNAELTQSFFSVHLNLQYVPVRPIRQRLSGSSLKCTYKFTPSPKTPAVICYQLTGPSSKKETSAAKFKGSLGTFCTEHAMVGREIREYRSTPQKQGLLASNRWKNRESVFNEWNETCWCWQLLIILEVPVFPCNASLTTDSGGQCKVWARSRQTIAVHIFMKIFIYFGSGLLTPMSALTLDEWEIPRDRVVINRYTSKD
jgi:hypothetical protein